MFGGGGLLLIVFLFNEWFQPVPFFKLQLLARRNLTHGLSTLVGAVILLVGVAAIPGQYLARIHAYRPLQTTPLMTVDPLNDSFLTTGFELISAPIVLGSPVTMFSTPGGTPRVRPAPRVRMRPCG
jgi:hypothetical protein